MTQGSENLDPDILQCKKDILKAAGAESNSRIKNANDADLPSTVKTSIRIKEFEESTVEAPVSEILKTQINISDEPGKNEIRQTAKMQDASLDSDTLSVPRFDLADDIMANHRKIVSISRKKPGSQPISSENAPKPWVQSSRTEPDFEPLTMLDVVSKIVSYDIRKLSMPNQN